MSFLGRLGGRQVASDTVKKGRSVLVVVAAVVLVAASPASAEIEDVVWDVSDCVEVAAVLPDRPAAGESLVVLAYRCGRAEVNGTTFDDIAVSEISVMRNDGSTLLRQVTDNEELRDRLRSLGVADSFLGSIDFVPGDVGAAPQVDVTFGRHRYSFGGAGAPNAVPPTPTTGGASYTYAGRKGTVTFRYENHEQSVVPSVVEIAACRDRALQRWMGASSANTPGIVATGAWTGSASLAP